jgi:hypothetical protein
MLLAMPRPWAWCLRPHDLTAWILSPGRTFPSRSGSLAMLLAMRLASFLLNDTDRSCRSARLLSAHIALVIPLHACRLAVLPSEWLGSGLSVSFFLAHLG